MAWRGCHFPAKTLREIPPHGEVRSHGNFTDSGGVSGYHLSAFWTREDPQLTSEFDAACPCPDGLMQDETREGGWGLYFLAPGCS
jgi:hypothetical protein